MTKSVALCMACICCHIHPLAACEAKQHACEHTHVTPLTAEQKISALEKTLNTQLHHYVKKLSDAPKRDLQEKALDYSESLAWIQERLDELNGTKAAHVATYNGSVSMYQNSLIGKMNATLLGIFEEEREVSTDSLPTS
jgi:uncharacterized protein YecT (DUF1311 family)